MNEYIGVLKKYVVFKGRASRKEYWMFFLFNIIISFVIGLIAGVISPIVGMKLNFIGQIYALAMFLPSIAVAIRRAHDSDHNGWFILIPIYNIILMIIKGTDGDNKYGPNPNMPPVSVPPTMSTPQPGEQQVNS